MTDYEHLSMIPGLLLAGHETTTNLLSMGIAHLLHHDLWDKTSSTDETRQAAIEELLRYESAITGMRRLITLPTILSGKQLSAGDILFVAYNSGSRDEIKFDDADKIDIDRKHKTQHLGFGRGIHACLGAPLARLLLRIELSVLRERLLQLRLETPYSDIQYHSVDSGRGVDAVRLAWDPPTVGHVFKPATDVGLTQRPMVKSIESKMLVSSIKLDAERVLHITLTDSDGSAVPEWQPSAHIDMKVENSVFRQYLLCGNPNDRRKLEIAVLEGNDTGVSHQIHMNVKSGSSMFVRGPRNNFTFEPGSGKTIFIAGGIGITPIRPMARLAKDTYLDCEVIYLGRIRENMAFADELCNDHGKRLTIWTTTNPAQPRFDLQDYLRSQDANGLRIYCCGPESLLAAVEDALPDAPLGTLRLERFTTKPTDRGPSRPPGCGHHAIGEVRRQDCDALCV